MITVKDTVEFCKKINIFFKYVHSHEFHAEIFNRLEVFYATHGVETHDLNEELTKHRVSCCACPINLVVDLLLISTTVFLFFLLGSIIFFCKSNFTFTYFYFLSSTYFNVAYLIFNFIYVSTMILSKPSDEEKRIFYREEK